MVRKMARKMVRKTIRKMLLPNTKLAFASYTDQLSTEIIHYTLHRIHLWPFCHWVRALISWILILGQELCSPRWQPTNNYPNTEANLKITAQKSLICQKKSPNLISECTMLKSQRLTIMYFTLIFRQRMKCSEIFPLSIPFPCVSLHLQMSLWWICLSHFWCSRGHIGQGKTELCQILG